MGVHSFIILFLYLQLCFFEIEWVWQRKASKVINVTMEIHHLLWVGSCIMVWIISYCNAVCMLHSRGNEQSKSDFESAGITWN